MWFYIATFVIVLSYIYLTRNDNYWKDRGVPYVKPRLFFGTFKDVFLGRKHFSQLYQEIYAKFDSAPYVGIFKPSTPAVLVRDPELIKIVLTKDFSSFMDNDIAVDPKLDPIFTVNIFTQTGEEWKKNRTAWTSGLTGKKLNGLHGIMIEKSKLMLEHLKNTVQKNPKEEFECINLIAKYFTDVTVTSALGLESNSFHTKTNPFIFITKGIAARGFWDNVVLLGFLVEPLIGKLFKLKFIPNFVDEQLMKLSNLILENRRKTGYQKNNAFDSMLMHAGSIENITQLSVAGFLFNFLFDGVETSAGVAAYTIYNLAKHPNIQRRLREEINDCINEHKGELSYEAIQNLKYLDMVISETMRMYPAFMSMQKLCLKPIMFPPANPNGKPVKIPSGMPVVIPLRGLHMDPKYFPEPEMFDPDRFADDNKPNIPKYAYLPFGEGPRICIGFRLAMFQIKVGLIQLIRNFEVKPSPRTKDPNFIATNRIIMRPVNGIWVTLHEIDSSAY